MIHSRLFAWRHSVVSHDPSGLVDVDQMLIDCVTCDEERLADMWYVCGSEALPEDARRPRIAGRCRGCGVARVLARKHAPEDVPAQKTAAPQIGFDRESIKEGPE